jgi:Carbohydrate-binding family 9
MICRSLALALLFSLRLAAQQPCTVDDPRATMTIPHAAGEPELNSDPRSELWSGSGTVEIVKDCSRTIDYPKAKTEVRGFWTDSSLYLLFRCPYEVLNLWLPADHTKPRNKLWDRDVVEMFLGDDWQNIRHYREFEIAPTGDWIDLAIDLDKNSYDAKTWRSGWQTQARIDETTHTWYAAVKIPLKAISEAAVKAGTRWRMNLYRIDGQGPDTQRHFLCWQPTCVVNRDPNHVPEHFGTLVFAAE